MSEAIGRRMHLVLRDAVPVSWNALYAGRHWTQRAELVDTVRIEVMAALHELVVYPDTFLTPVHITIISYKRSRPVDADNIMAKVYIDALKLCGLLVDDNPTWLAGVTTVSRVDREYPRIEITIEEVA